MQSSFVYVVLGFVYCAFLASSRGASFDAWADYPYKSIVTDGYRYSSSYGNPTFVKYQWDNSSCVSGLEITTVAPAPQTYSASIQVQRTESVAKGDTIGYSIQVRTIQSNATFGAGVQFIMEQAKTYSGYASMDVPMTNTSWTTVRFAISAGAACSVATPCQYNTNVGMPFLGQIIGVRAFEVRNYGQGPGAPKPGDLPSSGFSYGGREPDAPWRAAAAERIERYRKGNLTVRVLDSATKQPVEGARVAVNMTGHKFRFGSFLNAGIYGHYGNFTNQYFDIFKDNFNAAAMENGFDWQGWEQGQSSGTENQTFDVFGWLHENLYLNANKSRPVIRTHSLVWDNCQDGRLPNDICALLAQNRSAEALARASEHALNETAVTSARLHSSYGARSLEWDVANEISYCHDLQDASGDADATVADWVLQAAKGDPRAGRGLNDDDVCSSVFGTGRLPLYLQKLPGIQAAIRKAGGTEGQLMTFFGLESHFEWGMPSMEAVVHCMMALAPGSASGWEGLPLRVTEYDVVQTDLELYGDHLRDYVTAAFSIPGMESFLMWGYADQFHWRHSGPLFSNPEPDVFVPKPGYYHWRQLVFGDWWTADSGVTSAQGEYGVRGFLGNYEVAVTDGAGRSVRQSASMYDREAGLEVVVLL